MSVKLSPLVLLNISDSIQRNLSHVGCLRGYKADDGIFLLNSFEVPVSKDGSLDVELLTLRNSLLSQIYPEEGGIIGCYRVSDDLRFEPVDGLEGEFTLVFSADLAVNKDGKYFKVFDCNGQELRCEIVHSGDEAVNTVLSLRDSNTEMSQSKDMVDTQRDVLLIVKQRVETLIQHLQSECLDYDTLRRVNSLCHKLQYTVDDDLKTSLVQLENDYKIVQSTGLIHSNITSLENAKYSKLTKAANSNYGTN